jgi:hypothetical protein
VANIFDEALSLLAASVKAQALPRHRGVLASQLPLLPLPTGDVLGGSASVLHRAITEQHPVPQMRCLEELRKRQKKFSEMLFAVLVSAAPQEAKSLFSAIGAEYAYTSSPGGLHELLNKTMSDTLGIDSNWSLDDYARATLSRNPLDLLRNSRLSHMSLTDAVAQHLRDHFLRDEDLGGTKSSMLEASLRSGDPDHQAGNSALVGEASSPYLSRQQRGSIYMEKLLEKARNRNVASHLPELDVSMLSAEPGSPRGGDTSNEVSFRNDVIHTEHLNLTKNVSTLHQSILSSRSSEGGAHHNADPRFSSQTRRLSVKINQSLGNSLPNAESSSTNALWDPRVSIAAAFAELKEVHKARLRWVRKGEGDDGTTAVKAEDQRDKQPPRVSLKNVSLFDDMEFFEESDVEEKDRAFAFSIRGAANNSGPKELTEQDVKRFQRNRRRSKDMALIDATGLISNAERQPNEFFVPLMTVATQLMEFSDRTRSDLHWQVPPQWVEDSETFMVIRLDRPKPEYRKASGQTTNTPSKKGLEPVVHAAFLYDAFREITDEHEGNAGALFSTYHPGNAWLPNTPQPAYPWVECKVTRRKGIVILESGLGSYRVSEKVLQLLVRSADPPRIHVPRDTDSTALDSFIFDAMNDSMGSSRSVTPRSAAPRLPAPQDISSMVDDAALSAIIYRKAMLRRFFMPCTTTEGGRRSYTSKQPFDPDKAIADAMNEHHVDYNALIGLIPYDSPNGLADFVRSPSNKSPYTLSVADGDTEGDNGSPQDFVDPLAKATSPDGAPVSWTNMDFLSYDRMFKQFHRQLAKQHRMRDAAPSSVVAPSEHDDSHRPVPTGMMSRRRSDHSAFTEEVDSTLRPPAADSHAGPFHRQHRPQHVKFLPPMDERSGSVAPPQNGEFSPSSPAPHSISPVRRGTLAPSPAKVIMQARQRLESGEAPRSSTPLTAVEETILRMSNSAVVASNRLPPILASTGSHSAGSGVTGSSLFGRHNTGDLANPAGTRVVTKWSQLLPKATTTAKKS